MKPDSATTPAPPSPASRTQAELVRFPGRLVLSVERAAEALDVNVRTVYRLTRSGQLASIKVGGSVRIRVEAIERLLDDGERGGDTGREVEPLRKGGAPAHKTRSTRSRKPDKT
jgi:excisionase family DNA binding protein